MQKMENESSSVKRTYCTVKRVKKRPSILNLLLLQVGICLIVSVGVFLVRVIAGSDAVTSAVADGFFGFVTV